MAAASVLGIALVAAAPMTGAGTRGEVRPVVRHPTGTSGDMYVVVEPGDHLWSITEARLSEDGEVPPVSDVDPLWRRVIEENEGRLRSGDPDLIYPGERILVPDPGG